MYGYIDSPPNAEHEAGIIRDGLWHLKATISRLVGNFPFRPILSDNVLCRLRATSGVGLSMAGANGPRVPLS